MEAAGLKRPWISGGRPNLKVVRHVDELINDRIISGSQEKTNRQRKQKKNQDPFKNWKMPPQPKGYIRGKDNDCF